MGLVIIETNQILNAKGYLDWYNHFLDQKELGLILLPPGFKATYVPDDVEIKMEEAFKEEEKNECNSKRDMDY